MLAVFFTLKCMILTMKPKVVDSPVLAEAEATFMLTPGGVADVQ